MDRKSAIHQSWNAYAGKLKNFDGPVVHLPDVRRMMCVTPPKDGPQTESKIPKPEDDWYFTYREERDWVRYGRNLHRRYRMMCEGVCVSEYVNPRPSP